MSEEKSGGLKLGAGLLGCLPIAGIGAFVLTGAMVAAVMTGSIEEQNSADDSCTSSVSSDGGKTVNVPKQYAEAVKQAAKTAGLPEAIIAAQLQQESGWNPKVVSQSGARGIAQFMPDTWQAYGNGKDIEDPIAAIDAQGRYMRDIKKQMEPLAKGDANKLVQLTLAGYNAGPGAVMGAGGVPNNTETQNYVKTIMGSSQAKFSEKCEPVTGEKWNGDLGKGEWTNPLPGSVMTSGWGHRYLPNGPKWAENHVGLDFATGKALDGPGGVVIAPTDMKVVGFQPGDGCVMTKQLGSPGFSFAFCHMSSHRVKMGQVLKKGEILGVEGDVFSGGDTKTHLHFEIYRPGGSEMHHPYDGWNVNPEPILRAKGALPPPAR